MGTPLVVFSTMALVGLIAGIITPHVTNRSCGLMHDPMYRSRQRAGSRGLSGFDIPESHTVVDGDGPREWPKPEECCLLYRPVARKAPTHATVAMAPQGGAVAQAPKMPSFTCILAQCGAAVPCRNHGIHRWRRRAFAAPSSRRFLLLRDAGCCAGEVDSNAATMAKARVATSAFHCITYA